MVCDQILELNIVEHINIGGQGFRPFSRQNTNSLALGTSNVIHVMSHFLSMKQLLIVMLKGMNKIDTNKINLCCLLWCNQGNKCGDRRWIWASDLLHCTPQNRHNKSSGLHSPVQQLFRYCSPWLKLKLSTKYTSITVVIIKNNSYNSHFAMHKKTVKRMVKAKFKFWIGQNKLKKTINILYLGTVVSLEW